MSGVWQRIARVLTGRRTAWVVLALAAAAAAVGVSLTGSTTSGGAGDSLPSSAESAKVERLAQQFPGASRAPVLAVFTDHGHQLDRADLAAVGKVADKLGSTVGHDASPPIPSKDGKAVLVTLPVKTNVSSDHNIEIIEALRHTARAATPDDLRVQVTGGPAFGADIASSFDGANLLLLGVTVAIVALLLLLTYRSPVLWLVPLSVVGVAAELATSLDGTLGDAFGLRFDSGVVSVLVFGAGTNYALLLISRYREELRRNDDHRRALRRALRGTAPAILASNLTVVLALLTLVLAVVPSTSGLGVAAAVGLALAMLFSLLVLPAALAVCGRRLFWPFVPRPGDQGKTRGGMWSTVARTVTKRPAAVVTASVLVLAGLASGLAGAQLGLSQTQQFRVSAESVRGFDTLTAHYPPGEAEPVTIIARTPKSGTVTTAAAQVDGVDRATKTGTSTTGLTRVTAVLDAAPGTDASYDTVRELRAAVHAVPGAHAVVGGQVAHDLDVKNAAIRDLQLIVPVILALVFVILLVLLRALVATVILTAVNSLSALAAIGAGTWVGTHVFGFPALDVNVPLLAFLFLVALGIDYTIFLVTRAREETPQLGTAGGMTRAVGATGGVITSAGVVLAAVFAALGVLPLMTLAQLGLIVCIGILVDTLLVRTIAVPALFTLIGRRIWWPGRLAREHRDTPTKARVQELTR